MAEALYRKYRPQTFEDVVGQTHIERTLKNAIESDKVSHAYLFCGPRGTGKTTTARLLAKALLCECGPTSSPDGTCEQCLSIADGTHPDVSELDAASRTGVENVREEIIGRVQYAPTRGRYKIYIIDEVHMLSTAAFNALLKTLEEPPDHVVFVLCTTDPQRVPETIHSRCQRFDFHRLSNDEIVSRLGAVCVAEGVEFEGDALDLVAHRAQGGMRDALTALEQLIAFGGGSVTVEVAQGVLGSIDADDMSTVVKAIANRDAAACFTWLSDYVETGADLARFARDLAGYVRDLYVLALTDGSLAIDASQAARPSMAKEASAFGVDRLAYILGVLGDLGSELRASTNPRLSFEIALTRMVRPESDLTLEALAARIATLEAALASGGASVSAAVSALEPASGSTALAPERLSDVSAARAASRVAAKSDASAAQAASVPPVSSGYRPLPASAPSQSVSAHQAPAHERAAAFRAQMERRREARVADAAVSAEPRCMDGSIVGGAPPSSSQGAADASFSGQVSDALRAKISDPSALQRGWQAAIADLKRRRAAYGALLLSARAVSQKGGDGLFVEFSRENTFAFSAARKPDITAAIAAALHHAFGEPVPFEVTQGEGASSPAQAAMARAAALRSAPQAQAQDPRREAPRPVAEAPAYSDDDAVPYDDADAAAYGDASSYGAPWDDAPSAFVSAPAPALSVSDAARPQASDGVDGRRVSHAQSAPAAASQAAETIRSDSSDSAQPVPVSASEGRGVSVPDSEARAVVLSVDGPAPVDPYAVGKKLGFDSMPSPKRRRKGMIEAAGWPGVGEPAKSTPPSLSVADPSTSSVELKGEPSASTSSDAMQASGRLDVGSEQGAFSGKPDVDTVIGASDGAVRDTVASSSADVFPAAFAADAGALSGVAVAPVRPNPFADRPMPSGIGGAGESRPSKPTAPASDSTVEEMDVADIFGSFGVSFDKVQEEY